MPGFNINGSGGGQSNNNETSRKHRYLIRIFNPLSIDLLFYARKVALPTLEFDRITIHHKQEEIYLPGKHRAQQCEINFYRAHNANGDMAAREIYEWWSRNVINIDTSTLVSGNNGAFDKRTCRIDVLDGFDNPVHKYMLYGMWPQKITPDSFDYSDNNVAEISVVFPVDKFMEIPGLSVENYNDDPCEPAKKRPKTPDLATINEPKPIDRAIIVEPVSQNNISSSFPSNKDLFIDGKELLAVP